MGPCVSVCMITVTLESPIAASSTTLTGSAGQGYGVMGYMLSLDFGTNFTDTTPLNLYVRNNLTSPALASSTGDYYNMQADRSGGVNTNTIVFQIRRQQYPDIHRDTDRHEQLCLDDDHHQRHWLECDILLEIPTALAGTGLTRLPFVPTPG